MSVKAKAVTVLSVTFASTLCLLVYLHRHDWLTHPIHIFYWMAEVLVLCVFSILLAPLVFQITKLLLHCYVSIGRRVTTCLLKLLSALALEKRRQSADESVNAPVMTFLIKWMRLGRDEESVRASLKPENLARWLPLLWPLAILPFILEETAPFLYIALGSMAFLSRTQRHYVQKTLEGMSDAFGSHQIRG